MKKVAVTKTGSAEKRVKRKEKMAASERLTNGYMLCLTYGLCGIVLLEIVRRHYLMYYQLNMDALAFASKFGIVCGIIFAAAAAAIAVLGCLKKIGGGKAKTYIITFVVASLLSFFVSYDIRIPLSNVMLSSKDHWGPINFLANLDLARDTMYVEWGVVAFLVVAFIVYAIRLARIDKKKK